MRYNKILSFGAFVIAVALAACSSGGNDIQSLPTDMVSYHYSDKIDVSHVPQNEKAVAEKINTGEPIDFRTITQFLIEKDLAQYQSVQAKPDQTQSSTAADSSAKADSTLAAVTVSAPRWDGVKRMQQLATSAGTTDYLSLKPAYEAKIETAKNPIMYQKDASTIFDITERQLMQCFSGTNLNLVMARLTRKGSDYRAQHYVVIVKPGHVIPGEMVQTKQGYDLVGVETTASGAALVDMGLTKDLAGPMRIVDAEDYVIAELFGADLTKSFIQESLQKTEKEYGVPRAQLEQAIVANWQSNVSSSDALYNSSMFSFAPAETMPDTAMARSTVGENEVQFQQTVAELNKPIPTGGVEISTDQLAARPLYGMWTAVNFSCASGHAVDPTVQSQLQSAQMYFTGNGILQMRWQANSCSYESSNMVSVAGDQFIYRGRAVYNKQSCDDTAANNTHTLIESPNTFMLLPDSLVFRSKSNGTICPSGDTTISTWAHLGYPSYN